MRRFARARTSLRALNQCSKRDSSAFREICWCLLVTLASAELALEPVLLSISIPTGVDACLTESRLALRVCTWWRCPGCGSGRLVPALNEVSNRVEL